MLTGKFWIVPEGLLELRGGEHNQIAAAVMMAMPEDRRVPLHWLVKGIPEAELEAALARGADESALHFLADKKNDPRLFAMKEYGWVRTMKDKFNLWYFDCETADMVRRSPYWKMQSLTGGEMIDVYEFETGDQYTIGVNALLRGGDPQILKDLAMGRVGESEAHEAVCPSYSTAKYSELQRQRLSGRTGDNPRRRNRR